MIPAFLFTWSPFFLRASPNDLPLAKVTFKHRLTGKANFAVCFLSGLKVSALVPGASGPIRVRAQAGDTVLCSWTRHLTLTVPLSTQEYKWVLANCWGNLTNCMRRNDLRCTSTPSRGTRNTPSRFMLQNPGISSGSHDPVGSKASFLSLKYVVLVDSQGKALSLYNLISSIYTLFFFNFWS